MWRTYGYDCFNCPVLDCFVAYLPLRYRLRGCLKVGSKAVDLNFVGKWGSKVDNL